QNTGNPGNSFVYPGNPGTGGPICTISLAPPVNLVMERISPTEIALQWWKSTDTAEIQSVEYGLSDAQPFSYGAIIDKNTSNYIIRGLPLHHVLFGQVCAYNHGCKACSTIVDP